ncbi:MAG: hypothetical protein FWC50_00440 [Planctomycetaceae bacterium]|nr:hypothetical protein [Planctomycetaceae bacterium]
MNDTVLLSTGMKILVEHLGLVEAERFYYLVNKERFDYTEWRQNLFEGMTVEEISDAAMKRREEEKKKNQNQ